MRFRHSYFSRLFGYTLLLSVPLILLTGFLIIAFSASSIHSGMEAQTLAGVQAVSSELDGLLAGCDEVIQELSQDSQIREFLRGGAVTRYEAARALYLSGVNLPEGVMVHLMRVSDGELVSTDTPSALFQPENYNPDYTIFKRMRHSTQTQTYTSVKGIMLHADTRVVMGRATHDQGDVSGYVLVEISRRALETVADSYAFAANSPIFIMDNYDVVLYSTLGEEAEGLNKLDYNCDFANIWAAERTGFLESAGLCFSRADMAGYAIVAEVSDDLVHGIFSSASQAVVPVLAASIFIGIGFAYVMARGVSAPVRRLTDAMGEVERGNFRATVPVTSSDEIGRLSAAFNHMQRQIESLIHNIEEKQRNLRVAEINALSLQVNPHFLYNTLDLIKWNIKLERTQEAAHIVVQLGKLLRRLMNNREEIVSVAEELELVQAYLEIQRTRHEGRLSVRFEIAQDVYDAHIPKLVLQPLIENAIVHGLENKLEGGELALSAVRDGAYLRFVVQDNGAGMSAEKLKSVQRLQPNGMYNIGLSNVHERARLYGDARCGLSIRSALGEGTTITLTLLALEREEE